MFWRAQKSNKLNHCIHLESKTIPLELCLRKSSMIILLGGMNGEPATLQPEGR